tara:strand:+ start:2389 stop:2550 length:162 start_codon:yes stop_codon:yes gene_type:complete
MTPQEYNEKIDIITRKLSYEDDNLKKNKLSIQLKKTKLQKEIAIIREKISRLS